MSDDMPIEERLKRLLVDIDADGVWDAIKDRAATEQAPARPAHTTGERHDRPAELLEWRPITQPARRRPNGLRLGLVTCLVLILVGGAAAGIVEAIRHLGTPTEGVLVIDDSNDVFPTQTGETTQTSSIGQTSATTEPSSERTIQVPVDMLGLAADGAEEVIYDWLDVHNQADKRAQAAVYSTDAVLDDLRAGASPSHVEGRDAIVAALEQQTAENIRCAARGETIQRGGYLIQPVHFLGGGDAVLGDGVYVLEVKDGKIVHEWVSGQMKAE